MPAPFPIIKLGAVFLKQISKPIANAAAKRAKSHPFFRSYVCMPPAQFYNWCEIKLKMWVLNLGKPVNIPVLSEAMAIELGANLLGEGIMFLIAAGILVSEYNRSSKKDAAKEQARRDEINNLIYQLQELYFKVEQHETQLREMNRTLLQVGGTNNRKQPPPPEAPIIVPISNDGMRFSEVNVFNTNENRDDNDIGLVLAAVQTVQDDIMGNNGYDANVSRRNSFVTNALSYLEQDVYRNKSVGVK